MWGENVRLFTAHLFDNFSLLVTLQTVCCIRVEVAHFDFSQIKKNYDQHECLKIVFGYSIY